MSVKATGVIASILLHGAGLCAFATFGGGAVQSLSSGSTIFEISFEEDSASGNYQITAQAPEGRAQLKQPSLLKLIPNEEAISLTPKKLKSPQKKVPVDTQSSKSILASSESINNGSASLGSGVLDGRSLHGGIGNNPAQIIHAPRPSYPPRARKLGIEGAVILLAKVLPTGEVDDAQIERSSGRNDLDESARETVKNLWKFIPAKNQGVSISSSERIIVMFKLTDPVG